MEDTIGTSTHGVCALSNHVAYRRMIKLFAAGHGGTPDEVGVVGALLMGPDGSLITDSDFVMDGGVTAAWWYGELA